MKYCSKIDGIVNRESGPSNGTDTSDEAAGSLGTWCARIRADVLDYLAACGDYGATCQETEHHLGVRTQSMTPRFWELRKQGLIEVSGLRRKTVSGKNARVYVVKGGI